MIDTIKEIKGRLDCLVNCAGILDGEVISNETKVFNSEKFKRILNVCNSFSELKNNYA